MPTVATISAANTHPARSIVLGFMTLPLCDSCERTLRQSPSIVRGVGDEFRSGPRRTEGTTLPPVLPLAGLLLGGRDA